MKIDKNVSTQVIAGLRVNLPDSWPIKECSEVIDVRDGTHDTPKYVSEGIPLVTSKNLRDGNIDLTDVAYISEKDHIEISKRSGVEVGDTLLAMIGTIGNPVIVRSNETFSIKNIALFKKSEFVSSEYLKHFLNSPIALHQLEFETRGGTQKFVSLKVLRSLKIPLPPIAEQKRIVAILDKADAVRRKRREAIRLTEELLRSVFLDMFGDPITNPMGWDVIKMSKILEETQYGTSQKSNESGLGLPVLRMNNLTYQGLFNLSSLKYCEVPSDEIDKYSVCQGDLLFNRTNSPELVGKSGVWRLDKSYAFAGYLIRVRFKKDLANSEYVSGFLNSSYGKKYILQKAKPSINMSNFSASEFKKIPIPLPPLHLQEQFFGIVQSTIEIQANLAIASQSDEDLFNSLLQRAFTGNL